MFNTACVRGKIRNSILIGKSGNAPYQNAIIREPIIDISLTNFFGVISILIGFICFLLAGFLLAVPTVRKQPNRFLAVFLILTALELSGWLWVDMQNLNSWSNAFRLALGKLQMPVFFGFFLSSCYSDFRLKWYDSFHLIPFAAALTLSLPGQQVPFGPDASPGANLSSAEHTVIWVGSHILYYGYMSAIIGVLWRFQRRFRAHYSGGQSEVLTWLTQLAAVSLFAHTLILLRDVLNLTSASNIVLILQMVSALLALGITTWIALKSLLQPHLFRDVDRGLLTLTVSESPSAKAELARLLKYMQDEKPYLDPDLSLAALSDRLAMTPREVSEFLNQSLNVHFFDFVNRYRVEDAQSLLVENPSISVLQILHDVGFNSKSSFNTAFKKHAGTTPSAYRKQNAPA